MAFLALDGRYGDNYATSCPETVRLCLSSQPVRVISNNHRNMSGKNLRVQNLEVVRVIRLSDKDNQQDNMPASSWFGRLILNQGAATSPWYYMVSVSGWAVLVGMIIMSGILQCYLALAFLVAVPVTGLVVSALYGCKPRRLLVDGHSSYNRLALLTEHMNSMDWIVFYGESTIVNSLLNRPLEPSDDAVSSPTASWLQGMLRILILGQWGLVIGAAALKNWDAFFITFWVVLCIFSHAYLIPPSLGAKDWMRLNARIRIERVGTQVSSRRALLNTIIALNPDSFAWSASKQQEDRSKLDESGMRWVNPVLAPSSSRSQWEEATRRAMNEAAERYSNAELASAMWHDEKGGVLSAEWNTGYPSDKYYWKPFILEGIHMAAKIRQEASVPGRTVAAENM
ncbi:hypothetical protein BBP40_009296 [Aspergillus hancockii]|nr:hypothetical protein BBP40_009296 [Aspergillus hancockii]